MDERPLNVGPEAATSAVPVTPRRYFDGDESRYRKAADDAERNEDAIVQWMRYLKGAVVVLAVLALGLVGVVVFFALRSQVDVKFVVRNEEGQFRILGWDEYHPEVQDIKRDWQAWIRCARSITTDRDTHRRCWARVPMFIKERSQCAQEVVKYVEQRKPDQQLFQKSILVQDIQGGREPDGRWRFSWMEKTYQLDHGRSGPLIDTATWHAIIIAVREHPTKAKQIEHEHEPVNPLGLLCTHLSWWK